MSSHGGSSGGAAPATTVTGPDAIGAPAVVGTGLHYTRNDHDHGLPILDYNSMQYNDLLGWTFDPASAIGNVTVEAAATLELTRIPLPATETITNILLVGTILGLVLTHSYVALYKSNGVLIGQSADQSAAWGAGGTLYQVETIALAGGPYVCTPLAANDFVWAAIYVGTSTGTLPAFSGAAASVPFGYIPAPPRSRYARYPLANTAALTNLTLANLQNTGNGSFWMGIS